jgi:AcrR family transcriptional regulator
MRTDGLERATMRRLAQELDTGPASIYVYFASTAALHAAILDQIIVNVWVDARPRKATWDSSVIRTLREYTVTLYGYPSLARSAMTLRPAGPNHLKLFDGLLYAMRLGGIARRPAAWGVDVLLQSATAMACEQSGRDESVDAVQEEHPLATALHGTTARSHPGLAWAESELFSGTGQQRLEFSLRMHLAGIAALSGDDSGRDTSTRQDATGRPGE